MNNEKKFRRSAISIVCYVLAAAMLLYACYLAGQTVASINAYYAQFGMKALVSEYITYVLQSIIEPLYKTVVLFMFGYILDAVRRNNPANYKSDEEIEAAREAKRQAKEAKVFAAGEKAAEKAGNTVSTEQSVEADFAKSLDEELKADEMNAVKKKQNSNNPNRQGGNRSNQNRRRSDSGSGNKSVNSESGSKGGNKSGNSGSKGGSKSGNSGSKDGSNANGGKSGNNSKRRNNSKKNAAPKKKPEVGETENAGAKDGE